MSFKQFRTEFGKSWEKDKESQQQNEGTSECNMKRSCDDLIIEMESIELGSNNFTPEGRIYQTIEQQPSTSKASFDSAADRSLNKVLSHSISETINLDITSDGSVLFV